MKKTNTVKKIPQTRKNSHNRKKKKKGYNAQLLKHKIQTVPMQKAPVFKHPSPNKVIDFFNKSTITIKTALHLSAQIDIDRANTQLRAVTPRAFTKGVFVVNVKASGLYQAKFHQVNIAWDLSSFDLKNTTTKFIYENAPLHFECDCGRHTYYYRYIWTKLKASLGRQENRYPKKNNANLKGLFCKHGIRAVEVLKGRVFLDTFSRYVEAYKEGKGFRVSKKDRAKGLAQSYLGFN
jgi:hypothetical protein